MLKGILCSFTWMFKIRRPCVGKCCNYCFFDFLFWFCIIWKQLFGLFGFARTHRRGSGVKPPPIDDWKKLKTVLLGPISVFSKRLCFSVLYQIAYIISRNFHCDAMRPVVKLFWCVALEPMAGSKCKPGQGQWALKLESCCDVIHTLFSSAMAGQDNVSAQKAFLEENGCNACRYSACDVTILS